jgi:hypothetical protein
MRRVVAVLALVLLAACETSRKLPDGTDAPCVGLNQTKDSTLVYEYSTQNIVLGVLFSEVVVPPVLVVLNGLECPVRRRRTR